MDKLTQKEIDKYIKSGRDRCPKCQSNNISPLDGKEDSREGCDELMICWNCDLEWIDYYVYKTSVVYDRSKE